MLVKINKEVEYKLNFIAGKSRMKDGKLIERIFKGFFLRYEAEKGPIPAQSVGRRGAEVYKMYLVFKAKHLEFFKQEYVADKKQEMIDYRNLKVIKERIMAVAMAGENSEVLAISEDELLKAWEFLLTKMPEWWRENQFKITAICKHFEKILHQIQFSKTDKDILDDFIEGLSATLKKG
jgi:hypothetical protein